ncbi:hypothetical protein BP6252_04717 [Coleophoma cylindrospora]|uniref:non-specific serine/threonine protein kinase n=1 Tax=Coleophoma cylindrospora TaxID=1849047 RepID=A0A3D8S1A9_9HELO|nr:hypothetical protein BP6252_04717 [Coleophoma cylindrospora]
MDELSSSRPPTRRTPLGEATRRINNSQQVPLPPKSSSIPHHESLRQDGLLQNYHVPSAPESPLSPADDSSTQRGDYRPGSPGSFVAKSRVSAISREPGQTNSNRNSQISTVSTNASDRSRIKSYIGPWKLGKTLGQGATARVRLARHATSGQEAAIKIVQKKSAKISQAGSLADLDKADAKLGDTVDGVRRMPIGIEREVAIMKLIQHPHIMKLYDIWENRTEIYLVLEYVDSGELFEHITRCGRLDEEEAIKYFRQILSAVGYCHSFNICHRDLKPENILLNRQGEIKIADFGMAALHQSPDHRLKTSCGSPHYAAPELIKGAHYYGGKADIWSMGVILYATLAGRLPFDVDNSSKEWITPLLQKIRLGSYEMAPEFSSEAANLIWCILQVNPNDRITLKQIWRHPLLRKYDYLDDFGGGYIPQSLDVRDCVRPILRKNDIDSELLRHLRSLWHTLDEKQIIHKLMSEEPNDQKMFYALFLKYRDHQLENYIPDIGYSNGDYHHVRPTMKKTYSTCDFSQPNMNGPGRQVSRFTVISNVAETIGGETVQSYDPYKASRPQHLDSFRASERAKVTIHRIEEPVAKPRQSSRSSASHSGIGDRLGQQRLLPPRGLGTRSSLASSTRSRNSGVRAPLAHKRGVSFSHLKKRKASEDVLSAPSGKRLDKEIKATHRAGGESILHSIPAPMASTRYLKTRKMQPPTYQPTLPGGKTGRNHTWNEDVRQLSSSLAKDCDEAFNRISMTSGVDSNHTTSPFTETPLSSFDLNAPSRQPSLLDSSNPSTQGKRKKFDHISLQNRPLPPRPARSDSIDRELMQARRQAEQRQRSGEDGSPGYLDRMVSHIDHLIQPESPGSTYERRIASAPTESQEYYPPRPLPSINAETAQRSPRQHNDLDRFIEQQRRSEAKSNRVVSAPEAGKSLKVDQQKRRDHFPGQDPYLRDTIRVVTPSSPSPVKVPAPLTIRKKSSYASTAPIMSDGIPSQDFEPSRQYLSSQDLREEYRAASINNANPDLSRIEEDRYYDDQFTNESSSGTVVKKRSTWFKRNSKSGEDNEKRTFNTVASRQVSLSSSNNPSEPKYAEEIPAPSKKKGFLGRLFKKRNSKTEMTLGGPDYYDDDASLQGSAVDGHRSSSYEHTKPQEDSQTRRIEPQQTWLAKLFNVKPAARFLCFSVPMRRARQEVALILKAWKSYGIRDIQVDKERNIIFGKVGPKNYFDMKEVSFACKIMTVIEHGKRSHLSIAQFTQERGAASSFQKVVETLETVLQTRGLLVTDETKKRMMVKTLNMSS